MTNSEFFKIEMQDTLIRTPQFLAEKEKISTDLNSLKNKYPSSEISHKNGIIDVDLDVESKLDVFSEIQREDIDQEILQYELKNIPKLYRDTTFVPAIYLAEHHQQSQGFSCTLATALNTMEALGVRDELTENDIAETIGYNGEIDTVDITHALNFLKEQGLTVEALNNTLQIIETLENSGVVSLTWYVPDTKIPHQVLVSGVYIEKGKIDFIVNDPLKKEAEKISLSQLVSMVSHEIPNSYAVTK